MVEGRVTKKLSQECSRKKSRILGALSKCDELLLNPQVVVHSRSGPETSRNPSKKNQEATEGRSQNDPHPEARVPLNQSSEDCCSDEAYDKYLSIFQTQWGYCNLQAPLILHIFQSLVNSPSKHHR